MLQLLKKTAEHTLDQVISKECEETRFHQGTRITEMHLSSFDDVRKERTVAKAKRKIDTAGDQTLISKDVPITREKYHEREEPSDIDQRKHS